VREEGGRKRRTLTTTTEKQQPPARLQVIFILLSEPSEQAIHYKTISNGTRNHNQKWSPAYVQEAITASQRISN